MKTIHSMKHIMQNTKNTILNMNTRSRAQGPYQSNPALSPSTICYGQMTHRLIVSTNKSNMCVRTKAPQTIKLCSTLEFFLASS